MTNTTNILTHTHTYKHARKNTHYAHANKQKNTNITWGTKNKLMVFCGIPHSKHVYDVTIR